MNEHSFHNPLTSILDTIDDGQFFRVPFVRIYQLVSLLFFLLPIYLIYRIIELGLFRPGIENLVVVLLAILVFVATSIICGLIWLKRSCDVKQLVEKDSKIVTMPLVANLISTIGECYGVFVGIIGFFIALLSIFSNIVDLLPMAGDYGLVGMILAPIMGFFIILLFRFVAEIILAYMRFTTPKK
ncbi:MAG: hypothetical protein PHY71_07070 [Bacteroidaceae bacterium]|nr:hypothetical protein [Bacteroidaceae bacterium]